MENTSYRRIKRGEIYFYDFGQNEGSIQSGRRPVLVIQADNFNAKAPTILVAAITTVIKKQYLPSHIILGENYGLSKPSMVLLEQISTVNKSQLTDYVGFVEDEHIWRKINIALKKTFGLWLYNRERTGDIRCLCPRCLQGDIMAKQKRKDKSRVVLRTGESQRSNGTYQFSWMDGNHKRRFVYARTLDDLRAKEEQIEKDKSDGIKAEARYATVNDLYELWKYLKRGLKNNTFENYKYMYETFVRNKIGEKRISTLKKSDIKGYYNYLADERGLKASTIDSIHTVLHQILDMAVDDDYLRHNPSNNVLRELKQSHVFKTEKRRGLTRPEQELFLDFLKNNPKGQNWYPIFAVMVGTGLRVGEVTGLRWGDIDLENGIIDVNHTLVYYDHRTDESKKGCYFNVNTTKTPASNRQVPMLNFVKEAFLMEKEKQELLDLHCNVTIDGYTDFIFINRFGQAQHQATLNKAIRRIM